MLPNIFSATQPGSSTSLPAKLCKPLTLHPAHLATCRGIASAGVATQTLENTFQRAYLQVPEQRSGCAIVKIDQLSEAKHHLQVGHEACHSHTHSWYLAQLAQLAPGTWHLAPGTRPSLMAGLDLHTPSREAVKQPAASGRDETWQCWNQPNSMQLCAQAQPGSSYATMPWFTLPCLSPTPPAGERRDHGGGRHACGRR